MKLSQTRAAKIKEQGRYGDGRGLYLQITKAGSRSWLFRYELGGRERAMGLCPCADFTLEEARERARLARQFLKDGIDPLDVAQEARTIAAQAAAKAVTFRQVADAYLEVHSPKWARDEVRLEVGVHDPAKFNELAAPIEAQHSAPWLRRGIQDGAEVIRVVDFARYSARNKASCLRVLNHRNRIRHHAGTTIVRAASHGLPHHRWCDMRSG